MGRQLLRLEAIRALGLEETGGALRAGYLHYTTPEEVDRFLDRLEALAARAASAKMRSATRMWRNW